MEEYRIRVTRQAREQFREIYTYIENELVAPIAAKQILSELKNAMLSLATMPKRIHLTPEEPWHSEGVRRDRVKNFYIYFWVNDQDKVVQIIGVIYIRRDQTKQLEKLGKQEN